MALALKEEKLVRAAFRQKLKGKNDEEIAETLSISAEKVKEILTEEWLFYVLWCQEQ